jgi:TonB family protein
MMEGMVASFPRRQAGYPTFLTSLVLHAGFLVLCVVGTRTVVKTVERAVADTTLFFLPRLDAPQVDRSPARAVRPGGGAGGDGAGIVISANPPPRGFQVIEAVGDIPTGIPSIDPNARAIDPRDFTGRGIEGGVGWGVVGGIGPVDQVPGDLTDALYSAETTDARFTPAEMIVQPTFHYPRILQEAGIPGRAVVQFVIDTLGGVEPTSVRVLEHTHLAFADAARTGVLDARFNPARLGVHPVRQLSKMPVRFTLAVN